MLAAVANPVHTAVARWKSDALARRFCASRPLVVRRGAGGSGDELLDLYTVAFGNPSVVGYQLRLLRKYLLDDYHLTVVDNSTDNGVRRQLESLCRSAGTAYVGLPRNLLPDGSRSHGAALNWAWRNLVEPSGRRFVGLLDHDIYPFRQTAVVPLLGQAGVLGVKQLRGGRWYLWPGWCFFDRARLGFPRLDFMPKPGLDTGGGNWRVLFRHMSADDVPVPAHRYEWFYGADGRSGARFEVMGDWIHSGGASGWDQGKRSRPDLAAFLDCL